MKFYFYSPVAFEPWDWRNSVEQGIGGSETSHVEMAWRLARRGHEVTTYAPVPADCPGEWRGTTWQPLDQADFSRPGVWVLYRCPTTVDEFFLQPSASHAVWLLFQDWTYPDLTPARIARCQRLITLCQAHGRDLRKRYPTGADRLWITSNGLKLDLLVDVEAKCGDANVVYTRDPHKIMFASSPDRGLLHVLRSVERAREYVPTLELHAFYGYNNLDKLLEKMSATSAFATDKAEVLKYADQPWVHLRGRVDQRTLYREWLSSGLWVYQTNFNETSCITCMEAQACGAIPIFNPVYALGENVHHGIAIEGDAWNDPLTRARYAAEIVRASDAGFQAAIRPRMMADARLAFDWEKFVSQWEVAAAEDLRHAYRLTAPSAFSLPDATNPVLDALRAGQEWEPELTPHFAEAAGGLAIEVGAYVGTHTRQLAQVAKEVWAFEPQAIPARHLRANVAAYRNVVVREQAVYDRIARLDIVDEYDWRSGTSPGACYAPAPLVGTQTSTTLDQCWKYYDRPHVSLLKLDAEGCEAAILRGAVELITACRPFVLFERGNERQTARHGDKVHSARDWLTERGYHVDAIGAHNQAAYPTPQPLLSVVTPSIRPEGLRPVWECLTRQTYVRWEWLIAVPAAQFSEVRDFVWHLHDDRVRVLYEAFLPADFYQLNKTWNKLFREAKGAAIVSATDWLWFEDDALRKLAQRHLANPKMVVSAPTSHVLPAPGKFAPGSMAGVVAAFDWGGSLETNESLRWLARNLHQASATIHIVPACGAEVTNRRVLYEQALQRAEIPYDQLHIVDTGTPTETANAKVAVLRDIHAALFFDDLACNVEAARAAGVHAWQVKGQEAVTNLDAKNTIGVMPVDYGKAAVTWVDYRLLRAAHCGDLPVLEPSAVELNLALLPRALVLAVGGMDESYDAVAGMSEKELAYRLRAAGATLVLDKRLQARAIEHPKEWPDWDEKIQAATRKLDADAAKILRGERRTIECLLGPGDAIIEMEEAGRP